MSAIPQDTTVHHKKTVKHFMPTSKSFQKAGKGYFDKYVVEFTDGYLAEALSPRGTPLQGFEPGKEVWFRIGYRSTHGDEIEPVAAPAPQVNGMPHDTSAPRIANVHGHPAVVALGMAKEMRVARIAALTSESSDTDRDEALGMAGLKEDADTLLEWLLEKVTMGYG